MKRTLYIYLLSIFMLANGALFTWLFLGTPLSFCRQLIWGFGLYVVKKNYHKFKDPKLNRFLRLHSYFCCYVIAMSAITIFIYNFNLMRIAYAFWMYFSGLPFVLLPYIISRNKTMSNTTFYKIFVYLGLFLTLGLIADYMTGGMFTSIFLLATASDLEGLLEAERYCFLSEAPTTFAIYYCFCLISSLYMMYVEKQSKRKFLYLSISLLYFVGAWFTGSRQIVAALGIVFAISMIYYIFFVRDNKSTILTSLVALAFILPSMKYIFFSSESYEERFSTESIKEDNRYAAWEDGLNETVLSGDVKMTTIGKAVALVQGQKAAKGEITGRHYENTYYSRWSELGIYGTLFIFIPVLFVFKRMKKLDFFNVLLISLFLSYFFICYISPNGIHQTTQMTLYLSIGLFLCKEYFIIKK